MYGRKILRKTKKNRRFTSESLCCIKRFCKNENREKPPLVGLKRTDNLQM